MRFFLLLLFRFVLNDLCLPNPTTYFIVIIDPFDYRIMNYVTRRFLRCAMVVFSWFVVPYSRVTTLWVPRKKLPPMTNPLLEIRAVELAQMIRTKQVQIFDPPLIYPFAHLKSLSI